MGDCECVCSQVADQQLHITGKILIPTVGPSLTHGRGNECVCGPPVQSYCTCQASRRSARGRRALSVFDG